MKKYATVKYLKEIEVSELDITNTQKVFGKDIYDNDGGHEFIRKQLNKEYGYEGESEEISIDTLEKIIDKMKKAGANYMEIVPHGDHHGYVFYGLEIRKSTADEIFDQESKRRKNNELIKCYQKLDEEMKEISKKLNQ